MRILDKIEYKFGKFAIPRLNYYLMIIFAIGLIIQIFNPNFYYDYLVLDIERILHGEIWRLITFMFYPPAGSYSILISLLMLYVYYNITQALLIYMSDFLFNLYILVGIIFQLLAGIIIMLITHQNVWIVPTFFTYSVLLAFCFTYKDSSMLLYFIIPIKAIYIAYFELAIFAYEFIVGDISTKIMILGSLANVFLYILILKNKGKSTY